MSKQIRKQFINSIKTLSLVTILWGVEHKRVVKAQVSDNASDDISNNRIEFTSADILDPSSFEEMPSVLKSKETTASLFLKVSTVIKNVRYIIKLMGNEDVSSIGDGTITGAVSECFQDISDGKSLIASAISSKGIATSSDATFQVLAENISNIPTAKTSSDVKAFTTSILGSGSYTVQNETICIACLPLYWTQGGSVWIKLNGSTLGSTSALGATINKTFSVKKGDVVSWYVNSTNPGYVCFV